MMLNFIQLETPLKNSKKPKIKIKKYHIKLEIIKCLDT